MSDGAPAIAIVTGGSGAIGRAIAVALGAAGLTVVVNYLRNAEGAAEVVKAIGDRGGCAVARAADVADHADVGRLVDWMLTTFGRIDVLVNNAGINSSARFWETSEADWDRLMSVNLKGVYNCCRLVLPAMIDRKGGRIINISSVAAETGFRGNTIYAATKAGVVGLTLSLAREVGRFGILVNAVLPGYTPSDIHAGTMTPRFEDKIAGQIPLGRFGRPQDVAEVVAFLATSANYVTGAAIPVSGGWRPQI